MGFEGRVARTTMLDQLADGIEQRILTGQLSAGDRMPAEGVLAAEYGVSRPLVREALARLRARGYVDTVSGRGTFVRHPDAVYLADAFMQQIRLAGDRPPTADQLYEARAAIETAAARLAAARADDGVQAELDRLLRDMNDNVADPAAYTAADVGFHLALAGASGNPMFPTLLAPLMTVIVEGVYITAGQADAVRAGMRGHRRIFAALRSGDGDRTATEVARHLAESRSYFPDEVTDGEFTR